MSFLAELRRRNVIRVAIFYVISAWLLLQIADLIFEVLLVPDWTLRFIFGTLVAAFPFVLFLAWAYEVTPEGLKRQAEVDRSASITGQTARKLDGVIAGLLVVLVGAVVIDRFRPGDDPPPTGDVSAETSGPTNAARPQEDKPSRSESADIGGADASDERRSIAVLPFVNMSTEEGNEVFSDGISEEILNVLAKIPELKVAARTSSFQFKGQSLDIDEIGRTLRVDHVLEGSVRRAGDRVRVTAQLIQAADGFHLWSESYDRDLTDIFAIQDEIAAAIAAALRTTLEIGPSEASSNLTGTTSLAAYELYLEGMQQWHLREADSLQRARSLFEQAIAIDPEFAKAHAGLALTLTVISSYLGKDERPYLMGAESAARRAIELDPGNAEAYAVLGQVVAPAEAERYFERAIELKPSFATAYQWQGRHTQNFGELERAVQLMRRAFELDPRSRIIGTNLAWAYAASGRHDEGLAILADIERWAPGYNEMLETRAMIRLLMGDLPGARRAIEELAAVLGKDPAVAEVYLALFDEDAQTDALDRVLGWPRSSRRDLSSPALFYDFNLAVLLVKAGLPDAAEQVLLEVAERSPGDASFVLGFRSLSQFYCRERVERLFLELGYPTACEETAP